MLSILIPEHNCDCRRLVADLADQCLQAGILYEILVMDDASTLCLEANRKVAEISGCRFIESEQNLKAARIRNRLGRMAKYHNLLFLDSDLEVRDDLFIQRYLDALGTAPVLVGAIVYPGEKPSVDRLLRWKYGRKREVLPLAVRNRNPWKSLSSQNFLMEKQVFEQVPFDESIVQYGHEDTLLGLTLKRRGIPVRYIDNPLIHRGLDTSEVFLAKSLVATELYATTPVMRSPDVVEHIRIFRFYQRMVALKLDGLLAFKYRLLGQCIRKQLCGPCPSLLLFDFYRLGHLCAFIRKRKRLGL